MPDSEDWNFGSGDFSMDTWVKFNTNTGNMVFFHQQTASNNEFYWYINHDTDSLVFVVDGPFLILLRHGTQTLTLGTMLH